MWHKSNLQSQKSSTVCVRNPILWHDKIGIYQNRIFRFELNSICLSGQNRCLKLAFKTSPISNISLNLRTGLPNMSSFKHLMWLWFDLRKSHQGGHPEVRLPDYYQFWLLQLTKTSSGQIKAFQVPRVIVWGLPHIALLFIGVTPSPPLWHICQQYIRVKVCTTSTCIMDSTRSHIPAQCPHCWCHCP